MRADADASKSPRSPTKPFSNGSNALSPAFGGSAPRVANGHPNPKADSNGSSVSQANGHSPSNRRILSPTFYGHDREEVARILIQSLSDLGYDGAAQVLSQESGYDLEGPTVAAFRSSVLQGQWAEAEALLFGRNGENVGGVSVNAPGRVGYGKELTGTYKGALDASNYARGLPLSEGADRNEMLFWMRQQKYLELLEAREIGRALTVLRTELTPLHQDSSRLHALSSLMMCQSSDDLKAQAQWDGAGGESRQQLLSELSKSISPSVMIPEHRLAVLLDQVKTNWMNNCLYHNTCTPPSLYVDHACDRENFPLKTVYQLQDHDDEVWFLAFSHDGSKLATAGADNRVIVYETSPFRKLHVLEGHKGGVCYLSWSPDDASLISCGKENEARIWDTATGDLQQHLHDFTYPVTSAAWASNGQTFIIGAHDTDRAISICDSATGETLYSWNFSKEGSYRVHDLVVTPDGTRLVVLMQHVILVYDIHTREKVAEWSMKQIVEEEGRRLNDLTSISVSRDSRYILVSMNPADIRMIDINTGATIRRFTGQVQTQYMIRSAFGGAGDNFVVSGSEDSRIYIWRNTGPSAEGQLVEELEAHRGGCVNTVAWHPRDPCMFASAGDDHKVRIWSRHPPPPRPGPGGSSNGFNR